MERPRRMAACRAGAVAALVVLLCAACSDDMARPSVSTVPPAPATNAIPDTLPATTETAPAENDVPSVEQLADVEAATWEPATRSDELEVQLATESPTVQEAVDAFSVTYLPMPGATPSDLPAGDGVGTHTALRLVESMRDRLAPEQVAVLDELDAGVEAWAMLPTPDSTTSTTPTSTTVSSTAESSSTTAAPAGVRAGRRPALDAVLDRYLTLLGDAYEDWHKFKPALPQTNVELVLSSVTTGSADMDALYPLKSNDPTQTAPICRIRVFPLLWKTDRDDNLILTAFAHELFHCAQDVWNPGEGFPAWLTEGSASFAAFDLYSSKGVVPPDRYSQPAWWFKMAYAPLSARSYDAWALFESFRQFGGDAYAAVKSAYYADPAVIDAELDPTAAWLEVAGLDDLVFRTTWSANDLRSSSFPEQEWMMAWPTLSQAGPRDNSTSLGVRGVGTYVVRGSKSFSQQQIVVTMGPKVGFVLARATDGPLLSHSANGTVAIAEGDQRVFCFDEGGCQCPEGFSSHAEQMDGRDMVFSFAAQQQRGVSDVMAVEWDAEEFCHEEKKTAEHNGDPHLRSFDGQAFDVMAPGEFVLAGDDRGEFEVQVRNEVMQRHGTGTSVVALGDGAHRVTFAGDLDEPGEQTLAIDGEEVDAQAATAGDMRIEQGAFGIWTATWPDGSSVALRWNHGWFVTVALDAAREPHITGMLGTPDDDWRDDLVLADGSHVDPADREALDGEYAPRWYVDESTSLFDYAPGESPATFRVPPPSPPTVDDDTVAACADGLPADALQSELDACAFDVAVTGDGSFVGVYTLVVADRVAANPVAQSVAVAAGRAPEQPSGAPATGSALTLSGTLASGAFGRDGVVEELTGTIDVAEGSIILGQAELCAPDRDVTMRVTLRGSGQSNEVHLCDPFGFNRASAEGDEVVAGEAAVWASAAGTYDVRVTTDSQEALVTNVAVSTDANPTVIDVDTALGEGYTGRLEGRGDTVVLLLQTGDGSMTWNATGTEAACAAAQYGAGQLGSGDLLAIGVCGHAAVVPLGPTGDLVVPLIVYAHADAPVDVAIVPQPT